MTNIAASPSIPWVWEFSFGVQPAFFQNTLMVSPSEAELLEYLHKAVALVTIEFWHGHTVFRRKSRAGLDFKTEESIRKYLPLATDEYLKLWSRTPECLNAGESIDPTQSFLGTPELYLVWGEGVFEFGLTGGRFRRRSGFRSDALLAKEENVFFRVSPTTSGIEGYENEANEPWEKKYIHTDEQVGVWWFFRSLDKIARASKPVE